MQLDEPDQRTLRSPMHWYRAE